ncbi:MBL fold metallo-hydrolase [Neobacillus sp. PS3-40]|uniref:MBL fold metallo-hydrolase n=1 Tax=Neobacillus sp. PS3-40 TaxID=3070679 RepID=UPI0027DFBBE1|nr:MBL fold metallo-hydrolase [Neobacillus sp. PS3-40]WML42939.1 MBL fold metallo-hydrolase [Neobacillus sp. PS3-40]
MGGSTLDHIQDDKFEESFLPMTSTGSGKGLEILPDVYCYTNKIVNLCFIGHQNNDFVLVDAGMPKSAEEIMNAVRERFGENAQPKAIVITHGHFDHVGSIVELLEHWNVPVYAHMLEIPYLTGKENYPPGDPTVDGGLVSELSPFFPNHGINISAHVKRLPDDGTIPNMPGWKWIHTPGHTPGHISLFREEDRTLLAGDAFVTVKQESLYKVMVQEQEISGAPKYFTTDWKAAFESVKMIAALKPYTAVTGHGLPMSGEILKNSLRYLVDHFAEIAIPENGRYVN